MNLLTETIISKKDQNLDNWISHRQIYSNQEIYGWNTLKATDLVPPKTPYDITDNPLIRVLQYRQNPLRISRRLLVIKTNTTIKNIFNESYQSWKRDTAMLSFTTSITSHPEYQKIMRLDAEIVVPLILAKMQEKLDHWFEALEYITGQNPIEQQDLGNMQAMTEVWLRWGYINGYIAR
ncbi:MAG: hypothetical protein OXF49_00800 [Candidatus Saccharibacteria bacterium]|nr:hypothetical protein [Candidatus Saccharibacteria bacterium]MCY4088657.1 hypothetical protein [Candidatus Saccharibacteria bacterium]